MAWLSVGTCNEDLCAKMVQHGVLKENSILLDAFLHTDRGHFVPAVERNQAYHDRPFKSGAIHISAPHMYVTVLEALDLQRGQTFLNVGSGSGYLSCLASYILGEGGLCHGIEISEAAVEHSRICADKWKQLNSIAKCNPSVTESFDSSAGKPSSTGGTDETIIFTHGNCFNIDVLNTMSSCKYDKIYVGAGCPDRRKEFFLSMLADNGVLVVPINERNQMLRIKRYMGNIFSTTVLSSVHFAPLIESNALPHQLSIISTTTPKNSSAFPKLTTAEAATLAVYYSSLRDNERDSTFRARRAMVARSDSYVKLPPVLWAPTKSRHRQFPPEFRKAVFYILLCTRRHVTHGINGGKSSFGLIPFYTWIHILTFASRDWFVPQRSEAQLLQAELSVERQLRSIAEGKRREAEEAKRKAERERDLYKMVILKLRTSHVPLGLHTEDFDFDGEENEEEVESDEENEEQSDDEMVAEEETALVATSTNIGSQTEAIGDGNGHGHGHADGIDDNEEGLLLHHFEEDDEENASDEDNIDIDDAYNLIFSDTIGEGNARSQSVQETTPTPPFASVSSSVAIPSPAGDRNTNEGVRDSSISASFNSHTTNEFSIATSLGTSWITSELEASSFQRSMGGIHANEFPAKTGSARVGKHNRAGVVSSAALKRGDADSDSDSDYESASCVSFLSMESDSFSLERDPSKKHRSLSEEFVTSDRLSLSISNIEEDAGDEEEGRESGVFGVVSSLQQKNGF